jgi:hypothetical protein
MADAFARHYGVPVTVIEGKSEPTCTRTDCRYSMRGGLKVVIGNEACSTGFTAVFYNNTSRRYVITAGHCLDGNHTNGGSVYGAMEKDVQALTVDAQRVRRSNSSWSEVGRIWVTSSDQRAVKSYIVWDNVVIGTQVWKSGYKTGTRSGTILTKNHSPSYIPSSYNFVTTDYCSDFGDSGGSVFRNYTAYGVHSGKRSNRTCSDSDFYSIFGVAGYIRGALDVEFTYAP